MSSFLDLVDAVGAYYGTGSDQWNIIAQNGINSPEALEIIRQVPGVNVTVSNSGKILGYDFANAFPNSTPASSAINSNTQTGAFNNSFSSNIPSNAVPPSTDVPNGGMNSGAKLTGTGATIATVADKISLAVVGVALGTKLGKAIDAGIYAFNPTWFDENFPTINPETWDDMATTEGGKNVIRAIFGLQNDSATMYLDERLLAQAYLMYKAGGAYGGGGYEEGNPPTVNEVITNNDITIISLSDFCTQFGITFNPDDFYVSRRINCYGVLGNHQNGVCLFVDAGSEVGGSYRPTITTTGPYTITTVVDKDGDSDSNINISFPHGYRTAYKDANGNLAFGSGTSVFNTNKFTSNFNPIAFPRILINAIHTEGELPGVENNPNATIFIDPALITGTTVDEVLPQLKTNYPDLFNDSIYTNVPQPDGTTEQITYIPVPYPNNTNTSQPTSDTTPNVNPQTQPQVNPDTRPNSAQDIATDLTTPTPNAPDTGDGNTPPVVPPTGGASSLWAIYNPTQAQVDDFGAWLWSSNFVEQIKKLFSDPMQGIIGLHKIFATPATGAAQNIKVGYLDSGVPSAVVTSQYTDVDCGAVNVAEYFGNVFDYEDTNIRLYLPFIGIVDLSTSDVMRGNVRVVYHVDVITGACLADVIVSRDGAGGVLYQYSGDAAVRYPVSSGSYMGMVSGVLAIAGAVVGVASGGAALPAVMGAVGGIMNSHTDVKHSGSFSGAAGAMGAKIPYLIIERPQSAVANDFVNYQGIGDNRVVNVGSLAGYFKMTDVHTESVINASEQEIKQIKALLEGGVIQ